MNVVRSRARLAKGKEGFHIHLSAKFLFISKTSGELAEGLLLSPWPATKYHLNKLSLEEEPKGSLLTYKFSSRSIEMGHFSYMSSEPPRARVGPGGNYSAPHPLVTPTCWGGVQA